MKQVLNRLLYFLVIILLGGYAEIYAQSTMLNSIFQSSRRLFHPYGITSHITWRGYDYDHYQRNLYNIAESGNDIVRLDFNSPGIGWETGNIDFTLWDNVYNASKAQGIKMLPIVYKPRYKKYTKIYGDSYIALLNACLSRYNENTVGWEIWNEMDIMNAEDGTAPPAEYLPLLKDAYTTIKGKGSENTVLLGAMGNHWRNYLDDLLSMGASDYFDVLSVHYYTAKNPPESIISYYEDLYTSLKNHHISKPVWLTETGYVSVSDNTDADIFYTEVLPKAYKHLGIDCSKETLGILYDKRMPKGVWNQDNPNIGHGFKSCELVSLEALNSLSVDKIPVLMILFGEKFPKGYFEDLIEYVKKGGTIVFPEGGAVLYFEWDLDKNEITGVGNKYYKKFHIDYIFPWGEDAKKLGISKMQDVAATPQFASDYTWRSDDMENPKYLTTQNLQDGDEMITLLEGTDGTNTGPVAACYKLNSDLIGNIIIQTRPKLSDNTSESLQASRYPRLYLLSYAMGVEKVFSYCLSDRKESYGYGITHHDMTPKISVSTLKTLSDMLPSGSTRPVVKMKENQFIASWQKPNGEKIYCVWTCWIGQKSNIGVIGKAKYYNEQGKRIDTKILELSPKVIYIIGASSVDFKND